MTDNYFNHVLASFRLSGFFTTHALDCIIEPREEGEALIPILAGEDENGKISLNRMVVENADDIDQAVDIILAANPHWIAAVKIIEGVMTLPEGQRYDSIIATNYLMPAKMELSILAIPFMRAGEHGVSFGRTKMLNLEPQLQAEETTGLVFQSYYAGNNAHPQAEIWNKYLVDTF